MKYLQFDWLSARYGTIEIEIIILKKNYMIYLIFLIIFLLLFMFIGFGGDDIFFE